MAKLVSLVLCLTICVAVGAALKCYTCNSQKPDGCKESKKPEQTTCGNAISPYQAVCAYKVFYDTTTKEYQVSAGCEQIHEGTPLDRKSLSDCDPSKNHLEIKECRVCNKDLCNAAPTFSPSSLSLLCLPVMYFLAKHVLN